MGQRETERENGTEREKESKKKDRHADRMKRRRGIGKMINTQRQTYQPMRRIRHR